MVFGQLALTVAALFAGAAFYVSAVEQPARLHLDDHALLAEWKPSYRGGFVMQASLAAIGFLLGMLAWWQTRYAPWLVGAIVLLAGWPYTLLVMLSTNKVLLAIPEDEAGVESRRLIEAWGRMHLVRTGFGLLATAIFAGAALA